MVVLLLIETEANDRAIKIWFARPCRNIGNFHANIRQVQRFSSSYDFFLKRILSETTLSTSKEQDRATFFVNIALATKWLSLPPNDKIRKHLVANPKRE